MGSDDARSATDLLLPAAPSSIAVARKRLRETLDRSTVSPERGFDALLVVSELMANAIAHGSRDDDQVHVSFSVDSTAVLICVRDEAHGEAAPFAFTPDHDQPHGRGLFIVGQLADWSEQIVNGRREVHARLHV